MFKVNNNLNMQSSSKIVNMNNNAETFKQLKKLYDYTIKTPNIGGFSEFKLSYQNKVKNLDISDIELKIKPSILLSERPDEREIEISIKSLDKKNKYTVVLKRGDKKEVLDYLRSKTASANIENVLQQASESFVE